ncbi:hypothetical protein ACFPM0_26005 [Pseudonocardia sulfidoxydans]|uniref:hypothetical protein n=1 Tax=Pseudonocardia sulfidoxydans TaxID=54011 RepID=UPI00361069E8
MSRPKSPIAPGYARHMHLAAAPDAPQGKPGPAISALRLRQPPATAAEPGPLMVQPAENGYTSRHDPGGHAPRVSSPAVRSLHTGAAPSARPVGPGAPRASSPSARGLFDQRLTWGAGADDERRAPITEATRRGPVAPRANPCSSIIW